MRTLYSLRPGCIGSLGSRENFEGGEDHGSSDFRDPHPPDPPLGGSLGPEVPRTYLWGTQNAKWSGPPALAHSKLQLNDAIGLMTVVSICAEFRRDTCLSQRLGKMTETEGVRA